MPILALNIIHQLSFILFLFVAIGVTVRLVMLLLSILWILRERRMLSTEISHYPKISLLIPAYNEEDTIVESVIHAVNQEYPNLDIIVINDGSKDRTLELLIDAFELDKVCGETVQDVIPTQEIRHLYRSHALPSLIVIDKKNGGKADALNSGINFAQTEYILCVDADTLLTQNTIRYLVTPFLLDDRVVITSGSVRILPSPEHSSIFSNLQQIEFVNSISLFRSGWNFFNANLIVSGALGLFKKDIMVQVGGYHNLAIGEDMEIIIRIHRYLCESKRPYKIIQLAAPTCFTTALSTLSEMSRQRKRWQKGLLSSVRLNLRLILNPTYKWVGMAGLPFYILFEIVAPFAEVFGFSLSFLSCFTPT